MGAVASRFLILAVVLGLFTGCDDAYEPSPRATGGSASSTTDDEPADDSGADDGDSGEAAGGGDEKADRTVKAGGFELTAPDAWQRKQPRSPILAAEFTLPKVEGDEQDGRLTVSVAGGSQDANIERWRGQFVGKPDKDSTETVDVEGVKITVVDLAGKYNDKPAPFAPGVERDNYRMLGAIVPTGGQSVFIKAYGPAKTMEKQAEAFQAFLKTLARDGG